MRYVYPARFEEDPDGGLLVTFRDVSEAITAGASHDAAMAMGTEALGLALRGYLAEGLPLPIPSDPQAGETEVPVATADGLKLAVVSAFRASGLTKSELARRLDKSEKEVRRILDPDHPTKLRALEEALALLGQRVAIETIAA